VYFTFAELPVRSVTALTFAVVLAAIDDDACPSMIVENFEPFWSSAIFVLADVLPLKKVVKFLVMVAVAFALFR